MLILFSPKTLKAYIGTSYGEDGFTDLMKNPLERIGYLYGKFTNR